MSLLEAGPPDLRDHVSAIAASIATSAGFGPPLDAPAWDRLAPVLTFASPTGPLPPPAAWREVEAAVLERSPLVGRFDTVSTTTAAPAIDLDVAIARFRADTDHLEPVDVVAWGLGAVVAAHAVVRHPRRVRRLVLVDPTTPYWWVTERSSSSVIDARRERDVIDLRRGGATIDTGLVLRYAGTPDALLELPATGTLAGTDAPVLVVASAATQLASSGHHLARAFPRARLVRVTTDTPSNHPHALVLARAIPDGAPRTLATIVKEFLDA